MPQSALLITTAALPATAQVDPQPDAIDVVKSVAAEMVNESATAPTDSSNGVLEVDSSDPELAVSIDTSEPAGATVVASETSTSFIAVDAAGDGEVRDRFVQYSNFDGESGTVVQPLDNGVRLLTVIESSQAPTEYGFAFDGGSDLTPTTFEDGSLVLHDPQGEHRGYVHAPWAFDATGRAVPTHFEWRSGMLIQVVEHAREPFEYPVASDPTWTYAFDQIATSEAGFSVPGITYAMAIKELKRCFNCSFPIGNAPRAYPSPGQTINLNASPFSLVTVRAPVYVATSGNRGFKFRALAGHFDGEGSTIKFEFYNYCKGGVSQLRLLVNASVVRDRTPPINAANAAAAKAQWGRFVSRTAQNTGANQGYGGRC